MNRRWRGRRGGDSTPGWLVALLGGAARAVVSHLLDLFFDGNGPS
ncbi:hypothetical protein [Nocardiopsis flavescens]